MVGRAIFAALLAATVGCGSGSLTSPGGGRGGGAASGAVYDGGVAGDAAGGATGGAAPDAGVSPPCLSSPVIAGDLAAQWSYQVGQGYTVGMKVDPHGNLVVSGWLDSGSLTFGAQTFPGPNDGFRHTFMATIAPSGEVLWQRIFDGEWWARAFALDPEGNIYLVGTVAPDATSPADLGSGPLSGPGVLAKLDPEGNTIWSHGLEDVVADPSVNQLSDLALDVDSSGQIAVAGTAYGQPAWTAFVTFYDASGTYLSRIMMDGNTIAPSSLAFDGLAARGGSSPSLTPKRERGRGVA